MKTKSIEDIKQYRIIKKKDMPDLNSKGYLLQHIKSGARIFIISNDDRNKVFYVAFRTPPADSTGHRISWSTPYCVAQENTRRRTLL